MYGLSEETYGKIRNIITKYSNIQFKLFGSRVNGVAKLNSDIDIAVIGKLDEKEIFKIRNDFDLLDIPYKIDLVFTSEITKQELMDAILNEGVDL
ncbi:MAG: nucleotidyltransferase domain-containing protein [Oscillospiraceae bacterium]|nr:nucleotidyltransferase domain-containing protein [Oscillospiraceae bacterium]